MTFSEIKTFLTANRFGITNPGTKKLSTILKELVDAIVASNTSSSEAISALDTKLSTVYGFPVFDKTKAYVEKDLVIYSGKLYKTKAGGHAAGDWNEAHFTETNLIDEVTTLLKA